MNIRTTRKFATALALAVAAAGVAQAQTAPAAGQDKVQKLDTFVVTGSYIPTNETA